MAKRSVITGGVSTWINNGAPNRNYGNDTYLRLKNSAKRGLLWMRQPVPRGATVLEATLFLAANNNNPGPTVIRVSRLAEGWKRTKATWDNQPANVGAVASDTINGQQVGDTYALDVTEHLQAAADGERWYGWRVATDTDDATIVLRGPKAKAGAPRLVVRYSTRPQAPTDLRPDDGATSVSHPVLVFTYTDDGEEGDLDAVQVQISDDPEDFTAPLYDSGLVPETLPRFDLLANGYAGLADGDSYYWRVRVRDVDGGISLWSDVASLRRVTKGTLTLDIPTGNTITDVTPPVAWTLTGRDQEAYAVEVYAIETGEDGEPPVRIFTTGRTLSTEDTFTIPRRVIRRINDGALYEIRVLVWDTIDRDPTPGDPVAYRVGREVTFERDPLVAPPETLTVQGSRDRPVATLIWTRDEAPDSWIIERDGEAIAEDLTADETLVSGTTYRWVDNTARSGIQHVYRVLAVRNGRASADGPTATYYRPGTSGLWLGDTERDVWVRLSSGNLDGLVMEDTASVHNPIGSSIPVRIPTALRGYAGQVSGLLRDRLADADWNAYSREAGLAELVRIKERPSNVYRLVAGTQNVPVLVGDLTYRDGTESSNENRQHYVQAGVWQVGEFGFRPRL